MLFNTLERVRTQSIANYVCSGESLTCDNIKDLNFEERFNEESDNYYKQCELFTEKILKNARKYLKSKKSEKEMLLDDLRIEIDKSLFNLNIIMCELGMKIGFTMAVDFELVGYRNKRRNE